MAYVYALISGTPIRNTTAGTAVPLSTASTTARAITIDAEVTNTSDMFVGGPTVSMTDGMVLSAGGQIALEAPGDDFLTLSGIYVNSSQTNARIRYHYWNLV